MHAGVCHESSAQANAATGGGHWLKRSSRAIGVGETDPNAGILGLALLGGCSVTAALETEPGVDIHPLRRVRHANTSRRSWGSRSRNGLLYSGVHYCVYRYYGGKQPSHINASGRALLDIATLGFLELVYLADAETGKRDREEGKIFPLMAVSYDSQNIVIGAFPEFTQFTVLPPDGRAPAHDTPTPSPAVR